MNSDSNQNNKHNHVHGAVFKEKTELYFSIICGTFFFSGIIFDKFANSSSWLPLVLYISAYFFGGFFISIEAFSKIKRREFEIDFLMIAAAIGAAYIGSWVEGSLLLFLFSLGHALEHYAMNKAKKSITALGDLSPKTALVKKDEDFVEITIEELQIHDVIMVKPNAKISADGVIIKGYSSINQAPITGESMPIDKTAIETTDKLPKFSEINKKHIVFTGTINGDNVIEILVLKLSEDSTISRLVQMASEVDTKKSPTQLLTKKFEKWFVPLVILIVTTLCFAYLVIDETFKQSLYRAISVLIAASPCALAISTPSAVLSGIARAAKKGVLIKGGRALENLGSLSTIAFDKTGTLTEGKPKLTHVVPLYGYDKIDFLNLVLDVESLSNHPLANAISNDIKSQNKIHQKNEASNIKALQGKGVEANYRESKAYIGNVKLMQDNSIHIEESVTSQMNTLLQNGHTVMLVAYQNTLIGLLGVMDVPRKSAKTTLLRLKSIGIKNMIMLTGDHQNVGDSIANQIGLTKAKGNLLPEDKVTEIEQLKAQGLKVAMVGDGVNDAPAMASSTVGIAMGAAGSDVALETADIALMSDKIESLPFAIGLSRKSKQIIKQNLWISLGVVALLVPITILGWASIGGAVAIHEGSTLLVVLNALRLLAYEEA